MNKFTKDDINNILDILDDMYPEAECELNFQTKFQLLVAVVLSAQTTDKSVNKVTPALFEKFPDAKSMSLAGDGDDEDACREISEIIKRIGMYKTKSKNIYLLSKILQEKYDGEVPDDYDKLIELPGVGRKTANVVLSVGFGHQRIAVDTHVFRVSNRIGLVSEKDVLKTELSLMKILPENRWSRTHHNLIFLGRYCCDARRPKCYECKLKKMCKWEEKNLEE